MTNFTRSKVDSITIAASHQVEICPVLLSDKKDSRTDKPVVIEWERAISEFQATVDWHGLGDLRVSGAKVVTPLRKVGAMYFHNRVPGRYILNCTVTYMHPINGEQVKSGVFVVNVVADEDFEVLAPQELSFNIRVMDYNPSYFEPDPLLGNQPI